MSDSSPSLAPMDTPPVIAPGMDTSAPDFKPRPGGVMYNQVLSNNPGVAATLHGGGEDRPFARERHAIFSSIQQRAAATR